MLFRPCTRAPDNLCLFATFGSGKKHQCLGQYFWVSSIWVGKAGKFTCMQKSWELTINNRHKSHFYATNTAFQWHILPYLASAGKTDWNIKYCFLQHKSWHLLLQLGADFEANPCLLTAWFAKQVWKETQIVEQAVTLGTAAVPHSVLH